MNYFFRKTTAFLAMICFYTCIKTSAIQFINGNSSEHCTVHKGSINKVDSGEKTIIEWYLSCKTKDCVYTNALTVIIEFNNKDKKALRAIFSTPETSKKTPKIEIKMDELEMRAIISCLTLDIPKELMESNKNMPEKIKIEFSGKVNREKSYYFLPTYENEFILSQQNSSLWSKLGMGEVHCIYCEDENYSQKNGELIVEDCKVGKSLFTIKRTRNIYIEPKKNTHCRTFELAQAALLAEEKFDFRIDKKYGLGGVSKCIAIPSIICGCGENTIFWSIFKTLASELKKEYTIKAEDYQNQGGNWTMIEIKAKV